MRFKSYKERDNWVELIGDLQKYCKVPTSMLEKICDLRSMEVENLLKEYKLVSFKLNENQICQKIEVKSFEKDVLKTLMDSILQN